MNSLSIGGGLALVLAASATLASAQTPQRTTATYGDWTVRCEMNEAGDQACEMVQSITVQGQAAPIAQVAIGARDAGDYRLVVQLPINVWLPADVTLSAGAESVTAEFKRCFPQFCLAETEISDAMLAHLSSQSEPGAVAFQDAGQRDVSVPLSFNGLADANAALTADSESEEAE